jgi:hypothetical protein
VSARVQSNPYENISGLLRNLAWRRCSVVQKNPSQTRAHWPLVIFVAVRGSGRLSALYRLVVQVASGFQRRRSPAICSATLAPLALLAWPSHVAEMPFDFKRLKRDCASAQAELAQAGRGASRTGATAIIEPVLPLIAQLRKEKHSWAAIASALAQQGVVQGADRQPITARRMTALISAINKRVRRGEERASARMLWRDLPPARASSHNLGLSPDLQRIAPAPVEDTDSEETLRHREFEDRVRSLLKDDPA